MPWEQAGMAACPTAALLSLPNLSLSHWAGTSVLLSYIYKVSPPLLGFLPSPPLWAILQGIGVFHLFPKLFQKAQPLESSSSPGTLLVLMACGVYLMPIPAWVARWICTGCLPNCMTGQGEQGLPQFHTFHTSHGMLPQAIWLTEWHW